MPDYFLTPHIVVLVAAIVGGALILLATLPKDSDQ